MSIYTNWPLPAWLMLGKTLSVKRNCYAYQCLDNVDTYTYAKFDQTIPSGYKVRSNQQRQNHRKEWTAVEATGGLDALWRQICTLDSAGFLLKHKRVKLE